MGGKLTGSVAGEFPAEDELDELKLLDISDRFELWMQKNTIHNKYLYTINKRSRNSSATFDLSMT